MGHSRGGHFSTVCVQKVSQQWEYFFSFVCVRVPPFVSQQKQKGGNVFYRDIRLLKILDMQVELILNGAKIEADISSHLML